ncbi:MAG: DNA repair protein RecN [Negativicutes bacterium]|nr:DNA repair protein RecN [Negativicutes bacterium]
MLKALTVHNFALIEHATMTFSPGLNVLSGETGAGKSIFIDALSSVLGERASVDNIRSGQDFFRVEATFDLSGNRTALALLDDMAIPVEDAGNVIFTRRFTLSGKNTVLINGCQTPLSFLKKIAEHLVDIHGQHESQSLLRPETYIIQLDNYADGMTQKLAMYKDIYREWQNAKEKLADLQKRAEERERRLDMLTWQTEEIAAANLRPDEDTELEQQIRVLANSEKIATAVSRAYALLNGSEDERGGIVHALAETKKYVEAAARFDTRLEAQLKIITEALYQLQDVEYDLNNYFQEMEFNPARLSSLQSRLDIIYKLKKKYGATIGEVLAYCKQAQDELAELADYDGHIEKLRKCVGDLEAKLRQAADELETVRRQSAVGLSEQINIHLNDLGMTGARFKAEVERINTYNIRGANQVKFLFSANPGEEPKQLSRVASGGELSRLALALKAVLSSRDQSGTMVFDELDAGIGGKTAQMVGEKIAMVAAYKQVLCITHLPQIAVAGDRHFYMEKIIEAMRTKTVVRELEGQARIQEIARMMSGDDHSEISLENARNLLIEASFKKEKWKKKAQA